MNKSRYQSDQSLRSHNLGQHVAPQLPIGLYSVQAEAANLQPATQQNITLGSVTDGESTFG